MGLERTFKFLDNALQGEFVRALKKARIKYSVDPNGAIRYSSSDEETVENELIDSIRNKLFASWQVVTCPEEWLERYRAYMARHGVSFQEELSNGQRWFLIPRKHRPHRWNLESLTRSSETTRSRSG